MNVEDDFDLKRAEERELEILINEGMTIEVSRIWTAPFFKKKTRKIKLYFQPAGVMDRISREQIRIDIDEDRLREDPLVYSKQLVRKYARTCAKVVAIAYLNNNRFYKYLIEPVTDYFFWRLTSAQLFRALVAISHMGDYKNFTDSMESVINPSPIEKNRRD